VRACVRVCFFFFFFFFFLGGVWVALGVSL